MTEIVRLARNAVVAKLYDASRETRLYVSSILSYKVSGAEHTTTFKSGGWDGRSTFFDFRESKFPAGFSALVQSKLEKRGIVVQIIRKPIPAPRGSEMPKIDDFGFDPRYDYQPETMNELIKRGEMIAQVATGGGKSRIARMCFARIRRPTLFLTTRGVLMYQMKDAFEADSDMKIGVMGDSEWTPRRGMNVGMVQTLVARLRKLNPKEELQKLREKNTKNQVKALKKKVAFKPMSIEDMRKKVNVKLKAHDERRRRTIKVLEVFEFVIGEEAHEAGGDSYYEILKHCKNAHYRLALTATPFMKDDEESNMRLMAAFGGIGIKVSEKLLIDRGILAKPYFKFMSTRKPDKLYRTTPWQRAYKYGIVESAERNKDIVSETLRAVEYGLPVMILVQHKAHGESLKKMLSKKTDVDFIYGDHDQVQRKRALRKFAKGGVLIGTTILDVGVDVPSVGLVILAGGGKAEVSLRQRIGRGLRAKKIGPNVVFVIDFSDEHNSHTKGHAIQRRSIIEDTPGFVENIVYDFDYEGLGLRKVA